VVAFGGAKISDKIELVEAFLERADTLLIGGAMANTFVKAGGHETGRSLVEDDAVDIAADLMARPGVTLKLPTDLIVGDPDADAQGREANVVEADAIPPDAAAYDIGPATRERFASLIADSGTFFWNGPMGWFEQEPYDAGTRAVARAAASAAENGAFAVIGGGDSARAVQEAGLADSVSHGSTGGGASLEYLAHGTLPGLEALDDA
jgi:phosphoglycerate kinase